MKSIPALVFFGCISMSGTLLAQQPHPLSTIPHRDRTQLEEQGVVITGREYFQIFEPYIFSDLPVFITTDSILNAYHVLFEESVAAMEQSQAGRFGPLLDRMWRQLMKRGGSKLARLVLGVALELLGRPIEGATPEEITAIKAEAQRVQAAQGFAKLTWLGPAEPDSLGFDYSRFKPVGFYTRSEKMQRYFRTLSWLQAVPFRLANDEELTAITQLAAALDGDDWKQDMRDLQVLHRYAEFIGASDDWDIEFANNRLDRHDTPAENRENVRAVWRQEVLLPKINDQIRFAPQDPRTVAEPNFRIVSAWRLADAVLMQKTALREPGKPARWPSGLDVAAALGSDLAARTLGEQSPQALASVQENRALFRPGASLYQDYRRGDCSDGGHREMGRAREPDRAGGGRVRSALGSSRRDPPNNPPTHRSDGRWPGVPLAECPGGHPGGGRGIEAAAPGRQIASRGQDVSQRHRSRRAVIAFALADT